MINFLKKNNIFLYKLSHVVVISIFKYENSVENLSKIYRELFCNVNNSLAGIFFKSPFNYLVCKSEMSALLFKMVCMSILKILIEKSNLVSSRTSYYL